MKLELISHLFCPYVYRASALLDEKAVPYEMKFIDLSKKPPWISDLSPRGQVPVLVMGDKAVFESVAILEFIDETFAPRLMPEDPYERAVQRGWFEVSSDLIRALYRVVAAQSQKELDDAVPGVKATLGLFEKHLKGTFFAGETFGLVDVACSPSLYRLQLLEQRTPLKVVDAFPKVKRWIEAVANRPSVTKSIPEGFAEKYLTDGFLFT